MTEAISPICAWESRPRQPHPSPSSWVDWQPELPPPLKPPSQRQAPAISAKCAAAAAMISTSAPPPTSTTLASGLSAATASNADVLLQVRLWAIAQCWVQRQVVGGSLRIWAVVD
ncbi:uncharacterized protein BROUX77_001021 [Berkeleyomyces rouxiae]|uniref:uncharacterized protein n=1 Tax=Berkeleyomyces rouxiae TaxID=2035830 RepID=UPI003B80E293